MRAFEITTPYGDRYFIHEDSAIERADGANGPGDAKSWRFAGLVPSCRAAQAQGAFSMMMGVKTLAYMEANECDALLFKNGNPKYTVADVDHGTYREWGNSKYHGIKSIRRMEAA